MQYIPSTRSQAREAAHLQGKWLIAAQFAWVLVTGAALVCLALSVPIGYERLSQPCSPEFCASDELTVQAARDLAAQGISLPFYAIYSILVTLIFSLSFFALAALIFVRAPRDRMAWYVSITLILVGTFGTELVDGVRRLGPGWDLLVEIFTLPAWILFMNLLYLFPDGRYTPAWTRFLLPLWLIQQLAFTLYLTPDRLANLGSWPAIMEFALVLGLLVSGIGSQIYRYRGVSSPGQRQQTKWVLFGLACAVFAVILAQWGLFSGWAAEGTRLNLLLDGITLLAILPLPVSIGAAILRHRLWDIDLFINRALVYGILTLILAAIYFAAVFLLQSLVTVTTGVTQSPLVNVVSTLAIAGLFSPLRGRIQDSIDRQFYRSRYNAEATLAALGARLRDEVDPEAVCQHLAAAVQETMQPDSVSVWLLGPGKSKIQGEGRSTR